MPGYPPVERIVNALAILDAAVHSPATDPNTIFWTEVALFEGFTIIVVSTLDQPITVTMFGNFVERDSVADPAQDFLATIAVAAGGNNSRSYDRAMDGYFAHVFPRIQALGIPTTGTVTIYIIKAKRIEAWE